MHIKLDRSDKSIRILFKSGRFESVFNKFKFHFKDQKERPSQVPEEKYEL